MSTDLTDRILDQTAGPVHLQDRTEIRTAGILMASQAERELRIFSRDLDAPLYDCRDFLEPVRRLALRSTHSPVQILLQDAEPAVRKGHRLIELAHQLSSRIHIRRIPAEYRRHTEAYLLADNKGYVSRSLAEVFEATADFNAPMQVRRMHEQFEHIWERSEEPLELRPCSARSGCSSV